MSGDGETAGGERGMEVSVRTNPRRSQRSSAEGVTECDFERGPEGNEVAIRGGRTFPVGGSSWSRSLEAAGLCENSREAGVRGPQALSSGCVPALVVPLHL